MSKAFTRETDDLPETPLKTQPAVLAGGKDYLTPGGAQRLREELQRLTDLTHAPGAEDSQESQLARQRIVQLQQILATVEVVPPPAPPWEQVLFGATVTVRDAAGEETRYRIVGREEAEPDRDWVSWTSPVARALLKARLGQQVRFRIPAGEQVWEILDIQYE